MPALWYAIRVSHYRRNSGLIMLRRAIFLLLFASQSSTKVHLSADACSLDCSGGYSWELLVGMCHPVLQILFQN